MQDYRDLEVWKKAHVLVLEVYKVTRAFPPEERFAMTAQLRRAGTSICTNIAEGRGRCTDGDFARFLRMSLGSAIEADYWLLLARDLRFLDSVDYRRLSNQVDEVRKMLARMVRKLASKD